MVITAQMRDEMKQLEDDARFMQELEEKKRREMIEAERKAMTPAQKEEKARLSKQLVSQPMVQAANVLANIYEETRMNDTSPGVDIGAIAEAIQEQKELIQAGDKSVLEDLLISQAYIMQNVANQLTCVMIKTKNTQRLAVVGKLAMQSQTQFRNAITSLAELKGVSKSVVVHQVNKATNQQVNTAVISDPNEK